MPQRLLPAQSFVGDWGTVAERPRARAKSFMGRGSRRITHVPVRTSGTVPTAPFQFTVRGYAEYRSASAAVRIPREYDRLQYMHFGW